MFKTKDFYLKKVYDINGKKIGVIQDIYIDFYDEQIVGFEISNLAFFSKKNYISIDDVIEIGEDVVVNNLEIGSGLKFRDIKDMDVVDTGSTVKGVVEDLLICEKDYSIKAIVVTSGLIDKMIRGKEIILLNECILGEDYILYTGKRGISFKTMPHNMNNYEAVKKI
ncbi:PRC-barrel domain-containing protein [Clostridium weizhouense]|uniref:PRC-barrel domain-containing protein n=1 Tax=Clostridium weizhouense TaxID=2859781 RepID=A0ABS7AMF6_9CLOT|nr:PRC-barrel domain-containing protein [Clostridium weizhouense]MBW6409835.1 PRC-barrel domain-containing protein [Clostridium weizhouense]